MSLTKDRECAIEALRAHDVANVPSRGEDEEIDSHIEFCTSLTRNIHGWNVRAIGVKPGATGEEASRAFLKALSPIGTEPDRQRGNAKVIYGCIQEREGSYSHSSIVEFLKNPLASLERTNRLLGLLEDALYEQAVAESEEARAALDGLSAWKSSYLVLDKEEERKKAEKSNLRRRETALGMSLRLLGHDGRAAVFSAVAGILEAYGTDGCEEVKSYLLEEAKWEMHRARRQAATGQANHQ